MKNIPPQIHRQLDPGEIYCLPPIGLRPRCLMLEERLREISGAIGRYSERGHSVPQIWIDEFDQITKELQENKHVGII